MRIAFISPFIYRYKRGIEKFTLELAKALVQVDRSLEITILTWQGRNYRVDPRLSERITLFKVPYSKYYQSAVAVPFYFFNFIRNRYDVINIFFVGHGEAEALTFLALFRKQKFNLILQYPHSLVPQRYKEFKRYNLINKAGRIVSVSRFVADGVREFCGRDSTIIYNGFNRNVSLPAEKAKEKIRSGLGFSKEDKILLTVAALEERKGVQKVITALSTLKKQINNLKYLVLGEGPYRPKLESLIREKKLEKEVLLLGERDNTDGFYRMSDIFILLSYGEGFGLAILEAMGHRLPVVVSKRRPFDELVSQESGVLVDDNNSQEVEEALKKLLLDGTLRQSMGVKAERIVTKKFSWEKAAHKYCELFYSQI